MACSSEDGEQNHAKLIHLETPVQNMLKALLEKEIKNKRTTIDLVLLNHKENFRHVGNSAQLLLFPQGNQPRNLDDWDITLLCTVLRNCCLLQTTQENDVNAVCTTRNGIHHSAKPFISNADHAKYAHVYKTFITNTLNSINDQDLKAVINEQVQEAERPLSKQTIELCKYFHKSYTPLADDVNGIHENINKTRDILKEALQDLKKTMSILPEELQSKLKPPDQASFKLLFKECSPEEEKKISQTLVLTFEEELGKKFSTLSDDTCGALKDVVGNLVKRLQEKAELTDAEYGCVCIFIHFYDFTSYIDFLDDLVNGKLTEAALPLQTALRCCFGIEDLQVELVMEDEQFLHCFENTLDCVKNVCSTSRAMTREIDQDTPDTDFPDIIMSTFNTELEKNSDITLSKNDADKYGQVLKDAIKVLLAGNSQKQATEVRTEQEINRLTKDYNKTEEESISTTGENEMQSNLGEAEVIRSPKQCAESIDRLMLCKGTDEEQSPWAKAEKLGICSNEQTFGIIDEALLHQGNGQYQSLPVEAEEEIIRATKQSFESVDEALSPLGLSIDEVSKGSVIFNCKPTRSDALETLKSYCHSGRIKEVIPAFFSVSSAPEYLQRGILVQRLTIDAAFRDNEKEKKLLDVTFKFQSHPVIEAVNVQMDPEVVTRTSGKTVHSTVRIYQGYVRFAIHNNEVTVREIEPLVRFDQESSDEETYGWSPKNQKLKKSKPYELRFRILVAVTLLLTVLVAFKYMDVAFEVAQIRSHIDKVDFGRSTCRQLEASGLSFDYLMHTDTQSDRMSKFTDLQARLDELALFSMGHVMRTPTDLEQRLDLLMHDNKLSKWLSILADLEDKLDLRMHNNTLYSWICNLEDLKDRWDEVASNKRHFLMAAGADLLAKLDKLAVYLPDNLIRTLADLQERLDILAFYKLGHLMRTSADLQERLDILAFYKLGHLMRTPTDLQGKYKPRHLMRTPTVMKHELDLFMHIHTLYYGMDTLADLKHPRHLWRHIHKLIEWQSKVADIEHTLRIHTTRFRDKMSKFADIEHTLRIHTTRFRDKMSKFADQKHTSDLQMHANTLSVRISNLTVADEERIWLQERLSGVLMRESAGQLKETQNWSRCVKFHERTFCGDIIMLEKDSHIVCGLYEWGFVVRHVETSE